MAAKVHFKILWVTWHNYNSTVSSKKYHMAMLQKGDQAPDFKLFATPDQQLALHELKGKNVILAFYPADWSPVCSDQMGLYNEMLKYFTKHNATLLGISVDSKWCHNAFAKSRNLHFPLLADFQ